MDTEAPAGEGLPRDAVVEAVAAGDDEGWVVTGPPEAGTAGVLWRLAPAGTAEATADVPALTALHLAPLGEGAALVGIACIRGGAGDCAGVAAEVHPVDGAGRIGPPLRIWERRGPQQDSDGLSLVGESGGGLWVEHDGGVTEVTSAGEVGREVPRPDGNACVLEGTPYALDVLAAEGPGATAAAGPPTASAAPGRGDTTVRLGVSVYDGGAWRRLDGAGERSFTGVTPTSTCGRAGYEVHGGDGSFLGSRTPSAGWQGPPGGSPVPPPAGSRPAATGEEAGDFAVARDGTLLERDGGGYETTGLRLPPPTRSGDTPPPFVAVDASDEVIVGCSTPAAPGETTCTVVEQTP